MTFKTKHVRIGKWWIEGEFTRKPCLVERLMEESKVIFEAVNPKLGYFSDFFNEVKLLHTERGSYEADYSHAWHKR